MNYTQDMVWAAVGVFVPSFIEARKNGVQMNLPSCLGEAAKTCFMYSGDDDFKALDNFDEALQIVQTALLELEAVGWMTFGAVNKFKPASKPVKLSPMTFGKSQAAINLASILERIDSHYVVEKISAKLHYLGEKLNQIHRCDLSDGMKLWAYQKMRSDFQQSYEGLTCERIAIDHALNVAKAMIQNKINSI